MKNSKLTIKRHNAAETKALLPSRSRTLNDDQQEILDGFIDTPIGESFTVVTPPATKGANQTQKDLEFVKTTVKYALNSPEIKGKFGKTVKTLEEGEITIGKTVYKARQKKDKPNTSDTTTS